jgi:hypothetical protein
MTRKRGLIIVGLICIVLSGLVAFNGVGGSGQINMSLVALREQQGTGGNPFGPHLLPARRRRRAITEPRGAVLRRAPILRHQIRPFKVLRGPVGTKSQALRMAAATLSAAVSPGAGDAKAASFSAESNPTESASGGLHTVYEGSNVSAGLLPTARALCFVEVVSETSSSVCTTNPDVSSGLGLLLHTAGEYRLVGVLPEGATSLTVEEAGGAKIEVPLDAEGGYSFATKGTPITMRVSNSNSPVYNVPLNVPASSSPAAVQSPATPGG